MLYGLLQNCNFVIVLYLKCPKIAVYNVKNSMRYKKKEPLQSIAPP